MLAPLRRRSLVPLTLVAAALLSLWSCDRTPSASQGAQARDEAAKPPAKEAPELKPAHAAPKDVAAPPHDASRLANGVATKLLKAGQGTDHPADNDCIKAHFTAYKRDGSLFSSSRAQTEPELQCLRTSIAGLRDVFKLMVVGEQRRAWIPANLTFVSSEPDEPAPNLDLTFDLELFEIVKGPVTPPDLGKPPSAAKKTRSGVRYRVLVVGAGKAHPSLESSVRLRFTGFTQDGAVFETTELTGRPTLVALRELVPGLAEGITHMVVGEKTRFWVPAERAYGVAPKRRGAPAGPLVYDVELLAIVGR
jgi:FKBP-type peptidyl-prolyl cis-trans isomerase